MARRTYSLVFNVSAIKLVIENAAACPQDPV